MRKNIQWIRIRGLNKVMHIGCNQGAKYYIKGKEIQSTKEEKDLGAWVRLSLGP